MHATVYPPVRVHGGTDALGVPLYDFSTNSNACGPCPQALAAVQAADATRYPDASYALLRQALANGLAAQHLFAAAELHWLCDPASPTGKADAALVTLPALASSEAHVVLDRAYEPLRLAGQLAMDVHALDLVWQLWTPNKALGLTGERAAYAIAPVGVEGAVFSLEELCPSWPIGAHGVALLLAWCTQPVQQWLAGSLTTLRVWKSRQVALCEALGSQCLPSDANFYCARQTEGLSLAVLRGMGIKLRDATSFGLPKHVRLSVQPPGTQDALAAAMRTLA